MTHPRKFERLLTGTLIVLFSACSAPGLLQTATPIRREQPLLQPTRSVPPASPTTPPLPTDTPSPGANPTAGGQILTRAEAEAEQQSLLPQAGDAALSRAPVSVDRPSVTASIDPSPVALVTLKGWLPTPCHHLRIQLAGPDSLNLVTIQAYSVYDPQAICAQIVTRFAVTLPVIALSTGSYSLEINGQIIRAFGWPIR